MGKFVGSAHTYQCSLPRTRLRSRRHLLGFGVVSHPKLCTASNQGLSDLLISPRHIWRRLIGRRARATQAAKAAFALRNGTKFGPHFLAKFGSYLGMLDSAVVARGPDFGVWHSLWKGERILSHPIGRSLWLRHREVAFRAGNSFSGAAGGHISATTANRNPQARLEICCLTLIGSR